MKADFAHFNPKIGCHGNVPQAIGKKEDQVSLRSNTYLMVKIGPVTPVDSEIICLNCLF